MPADTIGRRSPKPSSLLRCARNKALTSAESGGMM
jgi:hypothetical protein